MKIKLLSICLVIVLIFVGLTGCINQDSSINSKTNNPISSSAPNEQEQFQEPETIETVLKKPDNFDSMYYEITMNMDIAEFGEQNALIKIWQKDPYIKEEITTISDLGNISILAIQGPDGTYVYDASKGKYVVSTDEVSSIIDSLQYFDNTMILNYISNQTLSADFEKEIIDGKETFIIEYSPTELNSFIQVKIWIWAELGLPLKGIIDMNMQEISMSMELIYGNYSFSDIPDSEFAIN